MPRSSLRSDGDNELPLEWVPYEEQIDFSRSADLRHDESPLQGSQGRELASSLASSYKDLNPMREDSTLLT